MSVIAFPVRRRSSALPTPHRALRARVLAALLAKGTPVPAAAVDLAIAATEKILTQKVPGDLSDKLVDDAIRELPQKLQ